jgi:hypothetical protein
MKASDSRDKQLYNAPTVSEVAAIYKSDQQLPTEVNIAVHPHGLPCKQISYLSGLTDAMVYPLFFLYGELGWSPSISHNQTHASAVRNEITPLQFYASRIAYRPNIFQPILHGRKLF